MYIADVEWRKDFGTDTILEDFHFHERDAFISVYPQGYHKTDTLVRKIPCELNAAKAEHSRDRQSNVPCVPVDH